MLCFTAAAALAELCPERAAESNGSINAPINRVLRHLAAVAETTENDRRSDTRGRRRRHGIGDGEPMPRRPSQKLIQAQAKLLMCRV